MAAPPRSRGALSCVFPGAYDDYDPAGPLAARARRDMRGRSDRSSDGSSSDQDSDRGPCGSGSTIEANDIFDTLNDSLGYGADSGFGW